jgi:hypothetical protein
LIKPKDHGGLGFTDTRLMNECLPPKWIIKLERGDGDLCSTPLRRKYLKDRVFLVVILEGALNFGRGCMKSSILVRGG